MILVEGGKYHKQFWKFRLWFHRKGKEDRPPMVSMMDEMQKTLARRRAKVERVEDDDSGGERKNFEKGSSPTGKSSSGSESPKPGRRRFGSTADEIDVTKLNGMADNAASTTSAGGVAASNADLEAMKQEILREMRKEMAKQKQEIIE